MKNVVLMPVYNSADYLKVLIDKIIKLDIEVVVVDDGSSDASAEIALKTKVKLLRHASNKGKGAAIRTGIEYLTNLDYEFVIIMDSDGQHEPEEINNFINRYNQTKAPVIVGNRMADTEQMPFLRKATNKCMSGIISKICHQCIPDSQCGFRLIKKTVFDDIDLKSSNYEIESEILIKASRKGYKIDFVPISTVYREEKSYINPFVDTFRFTKLLFNIYLHK